MGIVRLGAALGVATPLTAGVYAVVRVHLDCDGSFDPEDLPKVVDVVREGRADLALGQRRPQTRDAWPPHARLANRLLARRTTETGAPYAPRTAKSKVTGTVGGTVTAVRDMRRVWRAATR